MFTIDIVTLFPEFFAPFVGLSIVGRAVERNLASVRYHHLLDELDEGERADDAPFGGGAGMVLRIEPIARILDRIASEAPPRRTAYNRRSEPERPPVQPRRGGALGEARPPRHRLRSLRGHRRPAGQALPHPGVVAGRFRADRRRDTGTRVFGRDGSLGCRRRARRVARQRVVYRWDAGLPQLYASRPVPGRRRAGGAAFGRPCQNRAVATRAVAPSHRSTAKGPARGARRCLARRGRPVIPYGGCAGPRARLFVAPASTEFTPSASTALSTGSVRGIQDLRV